MSWRTIVMAAAMAAAAEAAVPPGWFFTGSAPQDYQINTGKAAYQGSAAVSLSSTVADPRGFATLMQSIDAARYKGKRVRLSAHVKAEEVKNRAGLWMRADGERPSLAFDNMENRPITGTSDWKRYEVVLDIPEAARGLYFGVLLNGAGTIRVARFGLEVVDSSVPVTSVFGVPALPAAPVNLDFEDIDK